jgi:hypothetical protein
MRAYCVMQKLQRVSVLFQPKHSTNRNDPACACHNAYWHEFPAVLAKTVCPVTQKVVKVLQQEVCKSRHPNYVCEAIGCVTVKLVYITQSASCCLLFFQLLAVPIWAKQFDTSFVSNVVN